MTTDTEQRINQATALERRLGNIEASINSMKDSLEGFIQSVEKQYVTKTDYQEVLIRVRDSEKLKGSIYVAIIGSLVSLFFSLITRFTTL
jgi:hypothetical protein